MKLVELFLRQKRATGKTYFTAQATKQVDGIMLCHSHKYAKEISKQYGITALSADNLDKLRGLNKAIFIDHLVYEHELYKLDRIIDGLYQAVEERNEEIIKLQKRLEHENVNSDYVE